MALQRFVESYSVSPSLYIKLPNTPALREKYSEAFKKVDLDKLTERVNAPSDIEIFKFPVSRCNEDKPNQNGRKYTEKLWRRVIEQQQDMWKGRTGLADHPPEDSDGEFKNAAIVWLDMEIDSANRLVWAVGTFVGEYGRLAQEIVDKGGRIGFSSSGFGELMRDGETVDPDTYVLERCADIVLNPSQDVFGDSGNALNIEYTPQKRESTINRDVKKENIMADTVTLNESTNTAAAVGVSKLEEKKFRKDIERFLEDASKITDPQARLQELSEILSYFNEAKVALDLKGQVEERIMREKKELEALLGEAMKIHETFNADSEQLKIGVALLAEEVKVAEAEAKDWEAIALVLKENNGKLKESLGALKTQLESAPKTEQVEALTQRIAFLETQRKRQFYAYNEETNALEANFKEQVGEAGQLKAKLQEAAATCKTYAHTIKALEGRVQVGGKQLREKDQEIETTLAALDEVTAASKAQAEKILILEGQVGRLQTRITEANKLQEATIKEFEEYKVRIEEENTPRIQPKFEERVTGYLNFNEAAGASVESFWANLVERHGQSVLPYEQQIRGKKTYKEASSQYMKFLPFIDDAANNAEMARLPEGNFPRAERKEMLESAGMRFGDGKDILQRNSWAH